MSSFILIFFIIFVIIFLLQISMFFNSQTIQILLHRSYSYSYESYYYKYYYPKRCVVHVSPLVNFLISAGVFALFIYTSYRSISKSSAHFPLNVLFIVLIIRYAIQIIGANAVIIRIINDMSMRFTPISYSHESILLLPLRMSRYIFSFFRTALYICIVIPFFLQYRTLAI